MTKLCHFFYEKSDIFINCVIVSCNITLYFTDHGLKNGIFSLRFLICVTFLNSVLVPKIVGRYMDYHQVLLPL